MTQPLDPPPDDEGAPSTEPAGGGGQQTDRAAGPSRRDTLTTLLRERRVLVLGIVVVVVVVVVAVVATLGVTLSGGDGRPVPDGTMPTLGSQFAVPPTGPPTSAPAGPAALPPYPGTPLWTVPLPNGTDEYDLPGIAVTDAGYVLEGREEVIGLDKAGTELWRFTPQTGDLFTLRVTGRQVFVGYKNPDDDRWPQPQVIIALDAATGKELWRETEASLWSVTTDTVHMSVCYGGQNNRVGDCTLSARDPADNSTRWQVPTYASSRVENESRTAQAAPTPPYLLVGAYASGADTYVLSAHDPVTGTMLGRGYDGDGGGEDGGDDRIGSIGAGTGETIVTSTGTDDNPADGCTDLLTGFTVPGAGEKWRYTARTAKRDDGKHCGSQPESVNDGRLAVTAGNGAPSVLNLDTGAVEWSAPPGGAAIAATGTTLLAVSSAEDGNGELVAYRVGDAEPVWRAPFTGDPETSTVTITGAHVLVTGRGSEAAGYDLKTGKAWSYGGEVVQETGTWFAVCTATSCEGFAVA